MKQQVRLLSVLVGTLLVCVPLSVAAAVVVRSGESVAVTEEQEVPDDFYAAGGEVTVSGKVTGDLYTAGGTVTMNGAVGQDIVAAGAAVLIDGPVGDDVRVAGGEVTIANTVGGDVLVAGGRVHILSTAKIQGDVLFMGGEVTIDGDVRGALSGYAQLVHINGPVLGSVSVRGVQSFELGDHAHIEGTVSYDSVTDIVRTPGSVVVGDITKNVVNETRGLPSSSVLSILAFLFTTLVYLLLFKARLTGVMQHTLASYGKHGLIGFGVLVITPIVVGVLLVSVIGLPVGIILLILYALLLLGSSSLVGIFVGAVLSRYMDGEMSISLKWSLIGTLGCVLLLYVPVVGSLLVAAISLIIMGGVVTLWYTHVRA